MAKTARTRFDLTLASSVLGRLAARIDERRICLALVFAATQEKHPYDMTALSAAMGLPRATLSRLVEKLIAAGELCTAPDPMDRRRVLLSLTPSGRKVAEEELQFLDSLMADAAVKRLGESAYFIKPVKAEEISRDQAVPFIRELYDWSQSNPDSVPLNFLNRLLIFWPDLERVEKCQVRHWGNKVASGWGSVPNDSIRFEYLISKDSVEYYRMLAQHLSEGMQKPTLHQVQIDWDGPGTTYQRIAIPLSAGGMILSTRYLDFDYDRLLRKPT